ncbi:MAG: hypothetical protein ACK54F_05115 [Planctomycetia bacterium]|jgi:hypothetical protein
MNSVWKWLGAAVCGLGLLGIVDRMNVVTASEDQPGYERSADVSDKLDRIAERLDRFLDLMESRRGPGGPPPRGDHAGPPRGPHRELPPEVRERMHEARAEMKERMEKAREKFRELEDRVKTLEAEVERLKTARAG